MNENQLGAYLRFLRAYEPAGTEAMDLDARLRSEEINWSGIAVCLDSSGIDAVVGDLRCVPVATDECILTELRLLRGAMITYADLTTMLSELLEAVGDDVKVFSRIDTTNLFPEYERALEDAGFLSAGERVEFSTAIAELDVKESGQLRWQRFSEELRDEFTRVFALSNEDSADAFDDPVNEFAELYADCQVDAHPDRLQIAYCDETAGGVFFARVEDTWGTVAFMGLVPKMRGRGIGGDVHARAVSQLAAEGARTYHDGTSSANPAMLRLFERMGCAVSSRMREFSREPRRT